MNFDAAVSNHGATASRMSHRGSSSTPAPQVVLSASALCCLVAVLCWILASTKFSSAPEVVARSGTCLSTTAAGAGVPQQLVVNESVRAPQMEIADTNIDDNKNRTRQERGSGGKHTPPRTVHIQALVLGDSLVSTTTATAAGAPTDGGETSFNASPRYDGLGRGSDGTTTADVVNELLQAWLVGRQFQRQGDVLRWIKVLEDRLSQSTPLDDDSWSALMERGSSELPPMGKGRGRQPPYCRPRRHSDGDGGGGTTTSTGVCVASGATSLLDLPGHSSALFSNVLEGCMSGHLFVAHITCATFMASIQSGLLTAASGNVDEVLFVVYVSVGINNALLFAGTWSPSFEAQRVTKLVEAFANLLVGRSLPPSKNRSKLKRPVTVGAVEWRKQMRMMAEWDRAATSGNYGSPLFPFSFSGKRRVLIVGAQLPYIWFFNNSTTPWAPSPQLPGTASGATRPSFSGATFTYPPADAMCLRPNASSASALQQRQLCYSACWLFTAMYATRQAGITAALSLENRMVVDYGAWADRLLMATASGSGPQMPDVVVSKELLPLRRLLAGDCGNRCGTSDWLREHPEWMKNFRDCVHFSLFGARRVGALLLRSIVQRGFVWG